MQEAPVIVSLDGLTWQEALSIAEQLKGRVWGYKIHDLFEQEILKGNNIIPILKQFGKVFLDLKFHDIPATVGKRVKVYADSGVDIMTVHASGGEKMIKEAVKNRGKAIIAAVTVLTSLDEEETQEIYNRPTLEEVYALAKVAARGGAQAIVSSPMELAMLANDPALNGLRRIVPGIRGTNDAKDDQQRTMSANNALAEGAGLLVIGRPITKAPNASEALTRLFPNS